MEIGKPLVSVLMTSFNREKYIAEAIESVLNSTYENFELIIVDDKSLDSTVKIALSYASKDNRIRVYINEKNLGDYPNRNKAASLALGKYLKYVDADDKIYPHGLELLIDYMEIFPNAGYGLCSLNQDKKRMFPFELNPAEAYRYHYFGPGLFHKAPLSSIIRKDAFDIVGGFSSVRMSGDFDMWHKLSCSYSVVLMHHGIVWYRQHEEQEMSHHHKFLSNYEQASLKYLLSEFNPLDKKEIELILKQKKNLAMRASFKNILKMNFAEGIAEWKRFKALHK